MKGEQIVEFEGPDKIAATLLEGITGSNGLIIPPDDYWPCIREICDERWQGSGIRIGARLRIEYATCARQHISLDG